MRPPRYVSCRPLLVDAALPGHFRQRAEKEPGWKRARPAPLARKPDRAVELGLRECQVAEPDAREGGQLGVDEQLHLEAGVLGADVDVVALQDQPEAAPLARRHAAVVELHRDALLGQA